MEENMNNDLECIEFSEIEDMDSKYSPATSTVTRLIAMAIKGMRGARITPKFSMPIIISDENYRIKYYRATKSNNWLRMHGYPMRRKIHH